MTEGLNDFAELTVVRTGEMGRTSVITVTPQSGTAQGKESTQLSKALPKALNTDNTYAQNFL